MSEPRHELRVAQLVEALTAGGAEALAIAIAGDLANRGHDSHLIVTRGDGPFRSRVPVGVPFHDLEIPSCDAGQIRRIANFIGTCRKLEHVLRAQRIQVLQTHLPKANFLGLCMAWRGVCRVYPTVHNNREFDYGDNASVIKRRLRRLAYRAMVGSCAGMITVSGKVRTSLAGQLRLRGRAVDRISVVSNGVVVAPPVEPGRRLAARRHWAVDDNELLLVGVGRLTYQKNFVALLESLACLPTDVGRWRCIIAGDGELRGELETRVQELGLSGRVTMPGLVDDVDGLLCAADIFCMTSLFEGLPLVLLEAMARALPVVACGIDGVTDVVADDIHACIVTPGDLPGFATALAGLIGDSDRRVALGRRGRQLICERFNFETTIDDLVRVYGATSRES